MEEPEHGSIMSMKQVQNSPIKVSKLENGGRPKYKPKEILSKIPREKLDAIMPSFKKNEAISVDFDKMNSLFTNKHAVKLQARQIDVLEKLSYIYRKGIVIKMLNSPLMKFPT
jgi:hypothetical protein